MEVNMSNFSRGVLAAFSRGALAAFSMALCLAQGDWKTAINLPGVDFTGMSKASRDTALEVLRSEKCNCGCDMKIAECRMGDPGCGVSRRFAQFVVREASAGKKAAAIREDLTKYANTPPPVLDEQAVKLAIDGDPVRGPANARVTIVEFSDFQCPFCAEATGQAKLLLEKFPKDVRLIFKQYPLESHSQAALAAEASLAAQAQGKFWEMHRLLFANGQHLEQPDLEKYAASIGLDVDRFRADMQSPATKARLDADKKLADDLKVHGTPTLFIDGREYDSKVDIGEWLDAEIAARK